MTASRLGTLKLFSLLFLQPGLARLFTSSIISTRYLNRMPKWPVPQEHRIVPRGIDGTTVYQTPTENRELNLTEYSSVGGLLVGLALGVVYIEQWGSLQSSKDREQSRLANHNR